MTQNQGIVNQESQPVLTVRNLNVGFTIAGHITPTVRNVSFTVKPGQCLAIVGESGSGKSVTARSVVGLAGENSQVQAQELSLRGKDLRGLSAKEWKTIRGSRIGFILQDALVSLDPLRPVGKEIEESLKLHRWGRRKERQRKVIELLASVGVPNPQRRAKQRPGELSGGLRQRALIASAITLTPELVIADEPTTALDVTVQTQVLKLLHELKAQGSAVVLISHDLSVVARLADHILVMTDGEIVESGPAEQVLNHPQEHYTQRLLAAIPGSHTRGERLSGEEPVGSAILQREFDHSRPNESEDGPALLATGLVKSYPVPGAGRSTVVRGVSFTLPRGRTLGIVGESGSGKSTTARLVLGLEQPDEGQVKLLGQEWLGLPESRRRALRKKIGVVYQDPLSSFDPRWTVGRILADALRTADGDGAEGSLREDVQELLLVVGLPPETASRFPLSLSGGQRQRIAIARALATKPEVLVLDEAVSALDVSVQARILDLLVDLQQRFSLSYLFVSHDLGVIRHMSDDVLVMTEGRVVEAGRTEDIFENPQHSYTRQLVDSLNYLGTGDRRSSQLQG